jgi:tetratricopeptide (TPR) repeat protein
MELVNILAVSGGVFLGSIASLIVLHYFEKARRQKAKIEELILNGRKYYASSSEFIDKEENFGNAIRAYEEALGIIDVDKYPVEYGITQNNLGTAYGTLAEVDDKAENSKRAIEAYDKALEVYTTGL